MLNLERFKYNKNQKEATNLAQDTQDVIPETPPKVGSFENQQELQSSGKKRKFDLSSDEEGTENVFSRYKKSRITHFMKKKPTSDKQKKHTNNFLSPDSGSDQDDEDQPKDDDTDERLQSLRNLFPNFKEKTLQHVCEISFTIDGAIAMLTQWKSEDIKNHLRDSSPEHDSQNSVDSNSYDSPLFATRKKKNCRRLDSEEMVEKSNKRAAKRLGLSSSSESDDDTIPKAVFPRLSCVVTNSPAREEKLHNVTDDKKDNHECVNGTTSKTNGESSEKKANGMSSFYSKKEKYQYWKTEKKARKKHAPQSHQPKSFVNDSLTMDNAVDENFSADSDSGSSDDEALHFSDKRKNSILDFFQNSSVDELITLHNCSRKKAEVILGLRTFKSWNDLIKKFEGAKNLGTYLLRYSVDLLKERVILKRLLGECHSISSKLAAEIESLHCHDHMTEGSTLMKSPSIIPSHLKLKPYQLVGLNWIALLHRNSVNGVLADEMGLGKTIQTIAFLAHLLEDDSDTGPHLVVVPSSTLDNWCREFSLWCPSMEVVLYRGSQQERRVIRTDFLRGRRVANVIVTTYNSAISTPEDRLFFRKLDIEYAVFDEGHMLKNMSSQRYINLMKIKAARRLLLTGTPLQNNLLELMSLLRFVMPHMFEQTTDTLVRIFSTSNSENKSKFAKDRINDAKNIMQPFVLRRLKAEVLKQLPEKVTRFIHCEMTSEQSILYEETKERYRLKLNKQSSLEMKNAFVELRKVANHHLLRRKFYTADKLVVMAKLLKREPQYFDSQENLIIEDMTVMTDFELHRFCQTTGAIRKFALDESSVLNTGKFKKLDELLPHYEKKGNRIVIFSQFVMVMDILERYLKYRNHKFIRLDGSTPVNIRLDLIDQFNTDTSILVFILSTKAGGLGINLTSANIVIIHDIDMNPYNDKQAEDRCHRLGQTKPVEIIRLLSKDTLEEGMLQLAENKLQLEQEMTINDSSGKCNDIASLLEKTLAK